mgnify:CR=1 FL=1
MLGLFGDEPFVVEIVDFHGRTDIRQGFGGRCAGLGRAFAGEGAIADSAAVLGRNPAAMMMFDKTAVSVAATMVDPDYSVDGAFVADLPGSRFDSSTPASHGNAGPNAVIPAAYMIHPVNDQWAVGFAMMTNYGLGTRFDDSFGAGSHPAAGLLAGETSLMSVNLNPNVAYRVNEQWSLGAGINYTTFFDEEGRGALAGTDVSVDSSWGLAGQVGLDMAINDRWFVNASAWLIDIDTDVHTAVGTINTSIDPVAFMFGVGYRF